MPTDAEIARSIEPRPIAAVADDLGLAQSDGRPCDRLVAKIDPAILARTRPREAAGGAGEPKLVLVSAITPTPAGEGKTTTSSR